MSSSENTNTDTNESIINPNEKPKDDSWVSGVGLSVLLLVVCPKILDFWGIPISSYGPYLAFVVFIILVKIILPSNLSFSSNSSETEINSNEVPLQQYEVIRSQPSLESTPQYAAPAIMPSNDEESETWRDIEGDVDEERQNTDV
jgi:hypothetical protein